MVNDYVIKEMNLETLFTYHSGIQYQVPKYQRNYVWDRKKWEALFEDIWDTENHFLGTIILKSSIDGFDNSLEIIDGQQRISSISLLYLAIFKNISEIDTNSISSDENKKKNLMSLQIENFLRLQRGEEYVPRVILSSLNNDSGVYETIINKLGIETSNPEQESRWKNRKLHRTYLYFYDRISEINKLSEIYKLYTNIISSKIITISVNSDADALVLFESLNNRGEELSAVDLIKTRFFTVLINTNNEKLDDISKKWKKFIENLEGQKGLEDGIKEKFLIHYYNANKTLHVLPDKIASKRNLLKSYNDIAEEKVKTVFLDIEKKSQIYNKIIYPYDEELSDETKKLLIDLINISAIPAHSFLLTLFSKYPPESRNSEIDQILELLVKFFTRRHILDYPKTRDLPEIFDNLVNKFLQSGTLSSALILETLVNDQVFFQSKSSLNDFSNKFSLNNFQKAISKNMYIENSVATRFLLCYIEKKHATTENRSIDLWEKNKKNSYVWSIEHILPQNQEPSSVWKEMFSDGNVSQFKDLREEYLHKLGNLTITGYNPSLGDEDFVKKKNLKDKKGDNIGFNNGLYLNRESVFTKEKWSYLEVRDRTSLLVDEIVDLFKFPEEEIIG